MITITEHHNLEKKRTLKKVRTNFLAKRPDNEEHPIILVPKPLNPYTMYMISGGWGIAERGRQIYMGVKYLNSCLNVKDVQIEESGNSRQVILRPQISNQACLMPWEYSVKRLESYGNLEFATFAHRIRELNHNYDRLIEEHDRMIKSTNQEMEKARINVKNLKKKMETTYPFTVMTFLYDKSGVNLHSVTFGEEILKEIGQSVEGFARWAEHNGIPILFTHGAKLTLEAGRKMLSQKISAVPEILERPEVESVVFDVNGEKRRVVIQQVQICEPTENGFVISWYVIIKNRQMNQSESGIEEKINRGYEEPRVKLVKYENQMGTSMGSMESE